MTTAADNFTGFQYRASELLKYLSISNNFTLMLTSGEFIKFTPSDELQFEKWLVANNVQSIRKEEGWISE
jgi:hypothetical protein